MKPSDVGLIAEVRFAHDALARGFSILQPMGNQKGYDCVLESGGKCFRVQVRACGRTDKRTPARVAYDVELRGANSRKYSKKMYEPGWFDALAIWLIPEQSWVMVDPAAIHSRGNMRINDRWVRDDWSIFGPQGQPAAVSQFRRVTPTRPRRSRKTLEK